MLKVLISCLLKSHSIVSQSKRPVSCKEKICVAQRGLNSVQLLLIIINNKAIVLIYMSSYRYYLRKS